MSTNSLPKTRNSTPAPGPMSRRVCRLPFALLLSVATFATAHAGGPSEMNLRQGIGNDSMNKVAAARLEGMLTGSRRSVLGGDEDCSTQIGNRAGGGSLLDRPADVIVVGDVINVCQ